MSHESQEGQPSTDIGPAGKGKLLKRSISIFTGQVMKDEFGVESVTDKTADVTHPTSPTHNDTHKTLPRTLSMVHENNRLQQQEKDSSADQPFYV